MTRILVVHASVGGGHTNAATAIVSALRARGERDITLVDYNDLVSGWQRGPVQAAYWWALGRVPALWRAYYRHTNRPTPTLAARTLASAGAECTAKMLAELRPELVISTFTGGAALVGAARAQLGMRFPHVAVATDFLPHRHWVRDGVDRWCAPCDDGRLALAANGAPLDRITVTGLPIRQTVRDAILRRPDLRTRYGLDARPVIVAAAGARPTPRAHKMLAALAQLATPAQVLVCFPAKLPASDRVRFVEIGLTPEFPELLAGCDLLVGKAGGATTAEATAAGRALVVVDPFPGQEEDNAAWLVKHGAAKWARRSHEVVSAVEDILANRHVYERAARRLARPLAADAVIDVAFRELQDSRIAA